MPISTTCPSCKAIFRLPEELAGKKVKCQKCESLFVVPAGDADILSPGVRVSSPDERKRTVVESAAAATTKVEPARPDDIPVTARFVADDDTVAVDDDSPERPRPRRGERRPRRDEKPRSALLPVLLALCGLVVFSCIGVGAFLAIWRLAAVDQQQPPLAIQKQPRFRPDGGFQNGGPGEFNGPGGRLPNLTPTIELKLDAEGIVRVDTELTLQDERNPDRKRHKHYAIQLEEGKRYQIDMQVKKTVIVNNQRVKQFDAFLYLLDDADKIVRENDDIVPPGGPNPHNQDSQIIYTALRTATYKIEATYCGDVPGEPIGEFILTVKRLPD